MDGRDVLLGELTPWQRWMLDCLLEGNGYIMPAPIGRSNGAREADRIAIAGAVAMRGHIDIIARDGYWCVTASGLGPLLWVRR